MAIQIRRGTNTEWESNNSNIVVGEPAIATDAERFFVGTASGDYAEFANLDVIAPAYDTSTSYVVGDVINRQGKLYSCNTPCSGAFNVSYWDEKSLAEILKDLENEIDYAQYEIGYASGKLITIDNGASEIPVKDLTLDIEAVQDLHGYDAPWAGGARKNKIGVSSMSGTVTSGYYVECSVNTGKITRFELTANTTYTLSAKVTSSVNGFYCDVGGGNGTYAGTFSNGVTRNYADGIYTITFTPTASELSTIGNVLGFRLPRYGSSTTFTYSISEVQLEIGSSRTSYEPYSNICPISGWDEVNVTRTGKNLFPNSIESFANSSWYGMARFIKLDLPNGTYTVSTNAPTGYIWCGTNAEGETIGLNSQRVFSGNPVSIIVTDEKKAVLGLLGSNMPIALSYDNQLELDSTATAYEPYNGATYTIDLDGTRYGGTLDVTTGVLTITHGYVDLGNLTWTKQTNASWNCFSSSITGKKNGGTVICSNYPQGEIYGTSTDKIVGVNANSNNIYVRDSSYMSGDASAFKTAMNGVQLVYELATPQVVQLTPTQVRTVLGTNNLWNQMNSNNELAYRISNALN